MKNDTYLIGLASTISINLILSLTFLLVFYFIRKCSYKTNKKYFDEFKKGSEVENKE